jgi:hypothetical protein
MESLPTGAGASRSRHEPASLPGRDGGAQAGAVIHVDGGSQADQPGLAQEMREIQFYTGVNISHYWTLIVNVYT